MLLPVSFAVSVISGGILVRKRATYKINERKRTLARIKPCPGPTSKLAKELEVRKIIAASFYYVSEQNLL